jgi:hypothetical protein
MRVSKYIVIAITGVMVTIGVAATKPPENQYKNLKVLPRNISPQTLSRIMVDEFGDGLGVSCTFCHAEEKGTHRPDYASDAKPEKLIARSMMMMTLKINKKYFMARHPAMGSSSLVVTCTTCHNGVPHPAGQ